MGVHVFAVVGLAFCRRAEDGVGFGDFHEAGGGTGVVGVAVWVVGFGEGVEGPLLDKKISMLFWFSEICGGKRGSGLGELLLYLRRRGIDWDL